MKTLVVYTSQTGFTQKYAQWIAERTGADLFDVKDVQKKDDSFFNGYEILNAKKSAISTTATSDFIKMRARSCLNS